MAIERITKGISLEVGEHFVLLYGVNTSDSFCSDDLILQDIQQVLHHYLKQRGYQRIAFYSGKRRLYFLDIESRNHALIHPQDVPLVQTTEEIEIPQGPLGKKVRFLGKKTPQTTSETTTSATKNSNLLSAASSLPGNQLTSRMTDRDVITFLQTFMEDTSLRSAIIFPNTEDLRRFELPRELDGSIFEWSQLLPSNRNLCVFIFHQDSYTEMQHFCQLVGLTFLQNLLANRQRSQNQVNICHVCTPTAKEIGNLIQYFRLKYQKRIVWTQLDSLTKALAKESRPLKHWYDVCLEVAEISLDSAYSANWTTKPQPLLIPTSEELTLALRQRVVGHQQPITDLVKLVRIKLNALKSPKPLVILLPGPTGTGKTELSKALAEAIGTTLERCDMGEYGEAHKVANLFGSPIGYVGAEQGGWLPNTLRRHPERCVFLFDEIEKADNSIWRQMLAFFDEGRASDANGTVIAGKDTICLLTTNLAGEQIAEFPTRAKEILQKTGVLPPEFIGRIDKVIPLSRLGLTEQGEMIWRLIKRFAQELYGIDLVVDRDALAILVQRTYEQVLNYGGRGANEAIRDLFGQELIELQGQGVTNTELIVENGEMQIVPSEREQPQLDFVAIAAGAGRRDDRNLEVLLQELDSMIGLISVKRLMREFIANEQAIQRLREAGYDTNSSFARHMLFLGNPGTGKTTVAALVGKILKALGFLKKGHFVSASCDSLIAEFVGQTAPKTRAKVMEALDGVLFIDEAYGLASGRGAKSDYGQEAINTLMLMMENYRDRLVVIFAGYTREMEEFININPGLQSRIAKTIDFPDYQVNEMLEIFLDFCRTSKPVYICPSEVEQVVFDRLTFMYKNRDRNFGNGRDVRKLFDNMLLSQRSRLMRDNLQNKEAMVTFDISDIPPLK